MSKDKTLPPGLHRDKKSGIIQMNFIYCNQKIRKSTSTTSEEEAVAILNNTKQKIWEEFMTYQRVSLFDQNNTNPTIDEILEKIYEAKWKRTSQKRKPIHMIKHCALLLDTSDKFKDLKNASKAHLMFHLLKEGKSESTAKKYISALNSALEYVSKRWPII